MSRYANIEEYKCHRKERMPGSELEVGPFAALNRRVRVRLV